MRILFVHQNFPGQFKHLAPALVRRGHEVAAFTMKADAPTDWQGVRMLPYRVARGSTPQIHPWLADFETKTIRGEAAFRAASELKAQGYEPDAIVAHPGWGESLFLKDVWPRAKLRIYCEFFYRAEGADLGFDQEFPGEDETAACQMRLKNISNLLHFETADAGLSPTHWQANTFPQPFRSKIAVVHDGVETNALRPNADVRVALNGNLTLSRGDEVVTFVNRHLEPYRGYHIFMRALPQLLRDRPKARVLIVGDTGRGYGKLPPDGTSWRDIFLSEIKSQMPAGDFARIFFVGTLQYEQFVSLLQLSTVHVYLTYPFVLSWSLLEAMSIGCAIVASDTAPVSEVIRHGETGVLVPFFDHRALAEAVAKVLGDPAQRQRLGTAARAEVRLKYDLQTICLPRQIEWVEDT